MATIRVLMRETRKWAVTPTEIAEYLEGSAYDVREDIAQSMFAAGLADPAEAHEAPDAASKKASDDAPKSKARSKKAS